LPLEVCNIEGVRSLPTRARKCVVERSVEEYSLVEPIGAPHSREAAAGRLSETGHADSLPHPRPDAQRLQPEDIQGICANPLADEPHPAIVGAVKRFGIVGLVACAIGVGFMRWCKSLVR
jgi:hypothetical protein